MLEGTEIVGVDQDATGVTATVKDLDTGTERRLRSQYLVGTDGAHSKVRELAGIEFDGRGVFSNSITIYFHAPLAQLLVGKNLSVIYVTNPALSGFFRLDREQNSGFLVVNTAGDTSRPEASSPASDIREERLIELVRAGAGVPDLAVKIDGVARWRATSDVARRFRNGRIFLAGDAAHLMPPNGGYGGNTGIHDGHNLAWKLALVLKGVAGPGLLDTYEVERRPVGKFTVEQAYTRYVTAPPPTLARRTSNPWSTIFTSSSATCTTQPPFWPTMATLSPKPAMNTHTDSLADPARVPLTCGSNEETGTFRQSIYSTVPSCFWRPRKVRHGSTRPAPFGNSRKASN